MKREINKFDISWVKTDLEKELLNKILLRRIRETSRRTTLCTYFYKLKGLNLEERINPLENN